MATSSPSGQTAVAVAFNPAIAEDWIMKDESEHCAAQQAETHRPRVLARRLARELSQDELLHVSGGNTDAQGFPNTLTNDGGERDRDAYA